MTKTSGMSRDTSAITDTNRSLIEKWIRFKLDLIGRLGEAKGKKIASKTAAQIISRRLNPAEAERFIKMLRQAMSLPGTPEVLFIPKPSESIGQKIQKAKAMTAKVLVPGTAIPSSSGRQSGGLAAGGRQQSLVARPTSGVKQKPTQVVSGDLNILAEPSNPYAITEVVPTPDIIMGYMGDDVRELDIHVARTAPGKPNYPYVPVRNPSNQGITMRQNFPGGRGIPNPKPNSNMMDTIYPYAPSDSPLDSKEFIRMDNLGTLLPPRPVLKPWQTAKQKLFQPGDMVINKNTHAVGQIRAIKGEEVMVSYGHGKYERVPMQDLAIYYGTIKKIKQAERQDTLDLARLVGYGKRWKSPKVVRK